MKQATTLFLAAATICISSVSGFPLLWSPKDLLPKRNPQPQSYSVVAVDGGSSAPPTMTVTDAVTQTILSTIIATPSNAEPTTSVVVQTVTVAATSASAPAVTSVPFDDGQWKTTYYFRSTVAPQANAAVTSTSASAQPSSTGASDPGQWSYWSGRSGNGQP
jgi:hypothetical protein